jgi:rhodanese-related sulfurtransferase
VDWPHGEALVNVVKSLGVSAIVLGLAAPFAGSPYLSARDGIDVNDIAQVIARGEDHIEPLFLAHWIRDRKPQLRVIDVRRPEEFAEYAIPTAENIPIESLPRASFAANETLVLYSEGGAHAAQAWMLLRAVGHRNVFFIRGGLVDWYLEVMSPVLPSNASNEEKIVFERTAELSRYFGGVPQIGLAAPATPLALERGPTVHVNAPRIASIRRRGC